MRTRYFQFIFTCFCLVACGEDQKQDVSNNSEEREEMISPNSPLDSNQNIELRIESDSIKQIERTALSFFKWNIESILNDSVSIAYDFNIVKSENGKCQLDSANYFRNLRKLGSISEKFIKLEWERVKRCSNFLSTLDWEEYSSADAYAYQDYCDIYYYYWTRTQEPYHGAEVKKINKVNNHYIVTLIFYNDYEKREYTEYYLPLVKVEKENGNWKITEVKWLQN